MNWFNANKAAIGAVLAAIGGSFLQSAGAYPRLLPYGTVFFNLGTILVGGGILNPDRSYRPYTGTERRSTDTRVPVVVSAPASEPNLQQLTAEAAIASKLEKP